MKMPRIAALLLSTGSFLAVTVPAVAVATSVAGCADENDPKTWAKRLDDQAQRAPAIKRLDELFNAAMAGASNNREDPKVKAVVDDSIDGHLDAIAARAVPHLDGSIDHSPADDYGLRHTDQLSVTEFYSRRHLRPVIEQHRTA